MNFLALFLSCVVLGISADPDYCSSEYKKYCGNAPHVGCNAIWKPSRSCPKDAVVYKANEIKEHFTDIHNYYRNQIALGKVQPFNPAARMATVQWDEELAKLAELNVLTCQFKHDRCRATKQFRQSGQNLAMQGIWSKGPMPDVKELINKSVKMWFDENKNANMNDMKKFNPTKLMKLGHFTEMTLDREIRVGCAMIKFTDPSDTKFVNVNVACNYASIHMNDQPIYEAGKAASGCATGSNPKFPGLCSIKEKFEVNWW